MGSLGVFELVLIFGAVLLIFGPSKLPQLGEALGKTIKNFRKASATPDNEIDVTPRRDALPQGSDQGAPASSESKQTTAGKV